MAVALVMMFGQLGGVMGNVVFPLLLDFNCTVPFFLLAALLFGNFYLNNKKHQAERNLFAATGGIVLFLPKDNSEAKS